MKNTLEFWETARGIYAIGFLFLGVVLVGIAIVLLRMLPSAFRVGQQFVKAIGHLARALDRQADADDTLARVEDAVTETRNDVSTIKKDVASLKDRL